MVSEPPIYLAGTVRYGAVRCGTMGLLVRSDVDRVRWPCFSAPRHWIQATLPPPPSPNLEYIHTQLGPLPPSFVDARKVLRYILEVSRPIPMPKNTII